MAVEFVGDELGGRRWNLDADVSSSGARLELTRQLDGDVDGEFNGHGGAARGERWPRVGASAARRGLGCALELAREGDGKNQGRGRWTWGLPGAG